MSAIKKSPARLYRVAQLHILAMLLEISHLAQRPWCPTWTTSILTIARIPEGDSDLFGHLQSCLWPHRSAIHVPTTLCLLLYFAGRWWWPRRGFRRLSSPVVSRVVFGWSNGAWRSAVGGHVCQYSGWSYLICRSIIIINNKTAPSFDAVNDVSL